MSTKLQLNLNVSYLRLLDLYICTYCDLLYIACWSISSSHTVFRPWLLLVLFGRTLTVDWEYLHPLDIRWHAYFVSLSSFYCCRHFYFYYFAIFIGTIYPSRYLASIDWFIVGMLIKVRCCCVLWCASTGWWYSRQRHWRESLLLLCWRLLCCFLLWCSSSAQQQRAQQAPAIWDSRLLYNIALNDA